MPHFFSLWNREEGVSEDLESALRVSGTIGSGEPGESECHSESQCSGTGPRTTRLLGLASRPDSGRNSPVGNRSSFFTHGQASKENDDDEGEKKSNFLDAAAMKDKVRQKLAKKRYDVAQLYKNHGVWQAIAKDSNFEKLTLSVIASNAIWIFIDTDHNGEDYLIDAHPIFQVAENLFCAFFGFEWLTRYMSFAYKLDGLRDAWFVFDGLMLVMMILETWIFSTYLIFFMSEGQGGDMGSTGILRIARLMRLSRMFRMAKLVRAMPELFVMLKGLLAAARSVLSTLLLLAGLLFIFSILFKQLTADMYLGELCFPGVVSSMYFLLLHATLRGPSGMLSTDVAAATIHEHGGFGMVAVFFFFVLLASVLLMNMLIGVLCEVVSLVAAAEKEEMLVNYVGVKLAKVMLLIDEDGGGTISRDEFNQILECEEAIEALNDVGVDVIGLVDFADFIFGDDVQTGAGGEAADEVELTLAEFMEVVLQLRGSNNATVKDIVDLRKFIGISLQTTARRLCTIDSRSGEAVALIHDSHDMVRDLHDMIMTSDKGAKHGKCRQHVTGSPESKYHPKVKAPASPTGKLQVLAPAPSGEVPKLAQD
eukprot:TRINITY_DN36310_c0_g1_i1.p1 TRINITY_DN36310_c0_g1~~TRINITY_DN36310_c0_g1_i1.p1  ORF type:complete len:617 (+),score=131.15 TRINITY_DN36310_c0_g1_i1:71-1852(+)